MNFMIYWVHLLMNLFMVLMVLVSVAFITLLERKVLGYIQVRKGPNKSGFAGIAQPFSDALKLFSKEISLVRKSNFYMYVFSPLISMFLMLLLWSFIPFNLYFFNHKLNVMFILCLMCLMVFPIIFSGWSSNSLYTLLGSVRSIAQTISYEVSLVIIIFSLMMLLEKLNLFDFKNMQMYVWMSSLNFFLMLIFFVSMLAEMNRTPFDFSEGESELVSGFNTEYMSGEFALIFISEYGSIMFMVLLSVYLFFGGGMFSFMFFYMYMYLLFFVLWVRGTFPRFRYDNLMYLCWMSYLPVSLSYLIFLFMLKSMFYY
uniref:NADH-ubiquinone oxidoreductase chain 1 n=1 Tax=Encyrtus infelix TaxID=355422 RepID=A0A411FRC9_9HYME|nr:NADH dehydrogenase subunit 1 [Encyrtus infelix]QBA96092.1 NADH dehydrogenase subunit 1 [Encyrtus infelix]QBA96105.1 NADH dehydrogenase subunit 1 [Encyrtus infelix]